MKFAVLPYGLDDLPPAVLVEVAVKYDERFLLRGFVAGVETAIGDDEINAPVAVKVTDIDATPKAGELAQAERLGFIHKPGAGVDQNCGSAPVAGQEQVRG